MAAGAQHTRVGPALRDAGFTGLVSCGLFIPLIGFLTGVNGSNELVLTTRWPLCFTLVAVVGLCRFLYSLAIAPWLAERAARPKPAVQPLLPSCSRLLPRTSRWQCPALQV